MIDFEFDNSNSEHFFNIVDKTSLSDFNLLISCLSQESEDVQKKFGIKSELNAKTGKKSPNFDRLAYFILKMYFCRVILIDLLSLSIEDFYNAVDDLCIYIHKNNQDKRATKLLSFDEIITFDNVLNQILKKNGNKRILRLLVTSDTKKLFTSKSFWDEIKKIRGEIVHNKLIKRSKNIYLDGIYYWLVLKFIDKLMPEFKESDPYLHFLTRTENVSFCLKEIKRCWSNLFGFLLTNPNMISLICRSEFFFEKKAYPADITVLFDEDRYIHGFITFLCKNSQHENSIIAITEANDVRCEFISSYKFNGDAHYIKLWRDSLKPNSENKSLELVMSKLESDSELSGIKKQ